MTSESKRGRASGSRGGRRESRLGLSELLSMDSERQSRLLLISGAVIILLLAAGFIGFGYYQTKIKPQHRTVLAVDGTKVDYSAMKRRMAYELNTNPSTYTQSQQAVQALPQIAYDNLLSEILLIDKGATDQKIQITDDEFNQALRSKIGVAQNADANTFANALRNALKTSGLHEDEYRRMVRADLIKSKITDKFTAALPATMPQAKFDVMQFTSKDTADQALFRVRSGQDWAAVAKDLTSDSTKGSSSSIDYTPKDLMNTTLSGFAFSANIGAVSDVITAGSSTSATYVIVHLIDRGDKPLTATQKPQEGQSQYATWLQGIEAKANVTNNWDPQSQKNALISVLTSFVPPTAVVPAVIPTTAAQGTPAAKSTPVAGQTAAAAQPPANPQAESTGNNPAANATAASGGGSAP